MGNIHLILHLPCTRAPLPGTCAQAPYETDDRMPRRSLRETLVGWFASHEPTGSAHAGAVLARHAEELMRTSGVMSVGVGANEAGAAAIVVGVAAHRFTAGGLPESIEGVPVVVQEVGRNETL